MKQFVVGVVASLFLAGCASMGGPGGTGGTVKDIAAQVRAITAQACGFLPLTQVVIDIIAAGQFTAPVAVANAICQAVTSVPTPSRGLRAERPTVSGVVVRGSFTNSRGR